MNISEIRHVTRNIVRSFGFLNPNHPCGLSFSKVHALIEIDLCHPITAKMLGEKLCLDKSSTSRLVQGLEVDELIKTQQNPHDARSKLLVLTPAGSHMLNQINTQANQNIQELMSYLTPTEQAQTEAGLKHFAFSQKCVQMNQNIHCRPIQPQDNAGILHVAERVLAEFGANQEGFAYADFELRAMYEHFSKPGWIYLVCIKNNEIIGGGGIGPLQGESSAYCELKKMYLLKSARGLGLGKYLLNHLLQKSLELGYQYCYLETLKSMEKANILYQKFNFKPLAAPIGNTGHFGCDAWYLRELG